MERKVEVRILNQPFTFIGEDEERIKMVALRVDDKINHVLQEHGIVNTMNAVIVSMMELMDDYLSIRDRAERFEGRTLRLLKKIEEFD